MRNPFNRHAKEYADLLAHWDSRQEQWTFRKSFDNPADPKAESSFKGAVRVAFDFLIKSRAPEICELTRTLREPYQVWLDTMRREKRGFKRIMKVRSGHFHSFIRAWETGAAPPPSATLLLEDGDIPNAFQQSAYFWDDLTTRLGYFEATADAATNVVAKRPCAAKGTRYPDRARWLDDRLRERSWNKHCLARFGGPDHKTTQKILDGLPGQEGVFLSVAEGLSMRVAKVGLLEIPKS